MLQWGVGLVVAAIAYSFIYSGRYHKNDVDKCKEYIKARKIFDEAYFETQEEALRIACSCYEKNIITKITIVIGFIMRPLHERLKQVHKMQKVKFWFKF
jgi:hypothetical protein